MIAAELRYESYEEVVPRERPLSSTIFDIMHEVDLVWRRWRALLMQALGRIKTGRTSAEGSPGDLLTTHDRCCGLGGDDVLA